jgi:hypothetical protein
MMRAMSAEFFSRSPLLIFPLIALGIFMAVFLCITARTLLTRRDELQRMAELPLTEEKQAGHE